MNRRHRSRFDSLERLVPGPIRPVIVGAVAGALFGGALIVVGLLRLAVVLVGGGSLSTDGMLHGLAFYVGGFIIGGALAGALFPLAQRIGGVYGLSIVMMTTVSIAIIWSDQGPVWRWGIFEGLACVAMGSVFGAALARGFSRW